jgi:plasmid stability protein
MKTTIELPDDLYRKAKSRAALHGRRLRDLVEEGLRLVLNEPRQKNSQPRLVELMKNAIGVVDSGVPDLGSNPKHLAGFGRDARRHR